MFAEAYASGLHKSKYWEPIYEDSLNLIAKLPAIAAHIYRCAVPLMPSCIAPLRAAFGAGYCQHPRPLRQKLRFTPRTGDTEVGA